jgi:PAS domain S-box-containing protein
MGSHRMRDEAKTKAQLIAELTQLRRDLAKLRAIQAERRRLERSLRENPLALGTTPIALSEEDFSAVKRYLDRLQASGVTDLRAHLRSHPEAVRTCARLVKVVDAERTALDLRSGKDKEHLRGSLGVLFSEEAQQAFAECLAELADGRPGPAAAIITQVADDTLRDVHVHWSVVPGHEKTWSRVLVSVSDVGDRLHEEIHNLTQFQRSLIDSAVLWVEVLDRNANIVFWNRAAEEISGYSRQEVVGGSKVWEWLYPDRQYREAIVSRAQTVMEKGEVIREAETVIRCKDGQTRTISWNVRGLRSQQGTPIACVALARDVTDQKRAEEALRQSEEKYRSLVEDLNTGVFRVWLDPGGRRADTNSALARMFGFDSAEEYVAWAHERKEMQAATDRLIESIRRDGPVKGVEMRWLTRDGRPIVVSVSAKAEYDDQGRLKWIAGTAEDVTARRQAEETLRQSEARFGQLLDIAFDGINIVELDPVTHARRLLFCNERYVEMSGRPLEQLMNAPDLREFAVPSIPQESLQRMYECVERGEPYQGVASWARLDGRDNVYEFSAVAVPAGDMYHIIGVDRDITERVRAQKELLSYQEQLRSLASRLLATEEGERRRIAAHVHDNIAQSLALATMKAGVLKDSAPSAELAAGLEEVAALIEQAMQASRALSSELSPPVLDELDFQTALEWVAEASRARHGLDVRLKDDGQAKPLHPETRVLVLRAVRELLANVAKHARTNRAVVSARRDGDLLEVTVHDSGAGFGPAERQGNRGADGGFGLFSIREQLSQVGGTLKVDSTPGRGTSVRLAVPLDKEHPHPRGDRR